MTPPTEGVNGFDGLTPPYRTIVADPPWRYDERPTGCQGGARSAGWGVGVGFRSSPYSTMTLSDIADLSVSDLVVRDAHLYLWTTNRYLRDAYGIAEGWGFKPSQVLTWCKPPMGIGPGGAFSNTTEFVLFARRGSLATLTRANSTWWQWKRSSHSTKPAAFGDLVEQVSPGPYVELFARAPRLGWDSWGHGYEGAA